MRLIIGGAHQGKLDYALMQTHIPKEQVTQGGSCDLSDTKNIIILNSLHLVIKRLLRQGSDPQAYVDALLADNPNVVIITDEIGCGIVPIDRFEREWREVTGRVCCKLVGQAALVERVFCGIATVLKGESV
ncbi:bifunctional adenosylcobinamide kinase/adenosylcobinamide-phosphate guanylyltransferase [Hydrogenoanaerobacterium sp.]|uniref:bifunctional adenosylcobinamide kinase/adenosylcobinamide-phosphate guanylyltransferase n=1 Tax=Hydrogenoanaerobacterium sp. TaxID=2953763 RepID=UPI0028A05B38|nr:bifunctional adenosylcobinamide kinase/adenosylcobinamide-phosphate guanylyltransferase [Hydrogenoanaerobacterium sp.]